MHTRQYRPRGGKSNKRKRTRDFFWKLQHLDRSYPVVLQDSTLTISDSEAEQDEFDLGLGRPSASSTLSTSSSAAATSSAQDKAHPVFPPIAPEDQLELFWESNGFEVRSLPGFDGRTIFNRAAAEYSTEFGPDWEEVQRTLHECVIFDLFKTFLIPPAWVRSELERGQLARTHQGTLHITRATGDLLLELLEDNAAVIALSYIGRGNSDRYIRSLISSRVAAKFCLIVICHTKADKGRIAKSLDPSVAVDDSWDVIQGYHAVAVPCIQVSERRQLSDCRKEIFARIRQYWSP